ncbi:MAG TPA: alpha/beta fold hydrolase [Actinocrinis sp.]|nr:alpha/beta fold hydrolase [Actinocrinis sp.]
MTEQRGSVAFQAGGCAVAGMTAGPSTAAAGKPLIVALHGGTYTGRYFDVDGSGAGSFMDVAAAQGYSVVSFDRPGYGASSALAPAENTFDRHAQILSDVIAQVAKQYEAESVFMVGHSIGGMIVLMVAAGEKDFRLAGVSVTGMGAVIRADGAAHALATLPPDATVDLPYDQRDQVMFGPAFTHSAAGVDSAHESYAPVPVRELIQAPQWPDQHLSGLADKITVPVHNALAEFDALWDSDPANVAQFAKMLTSTPFVDASVARWTGHSIDHHTLGHALHLRQLAFVEECAVWQRQDSAK